MIFSCEKSPFRNGIQYVCGDGMRLGEISFERENKFKFHFHAWADKLSKDDHQALYAFGKEQVLLANIKLRLTQ
ncbi:MAG: hypothetical protein HQ445_08120 [Polaromonas sp.]|nr:hypothetical protein [Polaromonas sp.]